MFGANRLLVIGLIVVVFTAVMMAAQGIYWAVQTRKQEKEAQLSRRLGTVVTDRAQAFTIQRARDGTIGELEALLAQADVKYDLVGLFARVGLVSTMGLVMTGFAVGGPLTVVGAAFGYYPIARLRGLADDRNQKVTEQLPEALDLLGRSLQAGHGVSEAMRVVAEELPQPVAGEFGRVYEEHNLGVDFREAMQHMVDRNPDNFDVKIFASSVLLQRDTGGNLIEILENLSNTVRQRFIFQGKVKSLTAEARFSAFILGGLPFFVTGALMYLRPNYLAPLVYDPLGRFFLGYVILSFLLGVFVMKELSTVDV